MVLSKDNITSKLDNYNHSKESKKTENIEYISEKNEAKKNEVAKKVESYDQNSTIADESSKFLNIKHQHNSGNEENMSTKEVESNNIRKSSSKNQQELPCSENDNEIDHKVGESPKNLKLLVTKTESKNYPRYFTRSSNRKRSGSISEGERLRKVVKAMLALVKID